jgi:hypothetical protein
MAYCFFENDIRDPNFTPTPFVNAPKLSLAMRRLTFSGSRHSR